MKEELSYHSTAKSKEKQNSWRQGLGFWHTENVAWLPIAANRSKTIHGIETEDKTE